MASPAFETRIQTQSRPPEDLYGAVLEMFSKPLQTLVPPWSWKAAALNAVFRAGAFFLSNMKASPKQALRAMVIEAVYAVLTAGLIGAVSQRLRAAKPVWATGVLVCLALPGVMILAQFGVHHLAHTPHLGAGLLLSFSGSALSAAFSLYAMKRGSMLGGTNATSLRHDLQSFPRITLDFVLAIPRALLRRSKPLG